MSSASRVTKRMSRVLASTVIAACLPLSSHAAQPAGSPGPEMRLDHVTRLVDPSARCGLGGRVGIVARRDDGRVYTIDSYTDSRIAEYDGGGQCVRTIGRQGGGPGEYESIEALEMDGRGRLHVFDLRNGHIILSREFEVVERRPVPVPFGANAAIRLNDTITILVFPMGTPDRIGRPIHVVNAEGERLRSLGHDSVTVRPDTPMETRLRRPARLDDRRFWVAHNNRYRLVLWDVDGRIHQVVDRDIPEFTPWETPRGVNASEPPLPAIQALRVDADGNLRVLIRVADERWRSAVAEREGVLGPGFVVSDRDRYWDTMVEVLDGSGGRIASQTFDPHVLGFADADHVVSYNETESGEPYADIWRISIVLPTER